MSVCWLVGFLKGQEVTFSCSYRSTYLVFLRPKSSEYIDSTSVVNQEFPKKSIGPGAAEHWVDVTDQVSREGRNRRQGVTEKLVRKMLFS